MKIKILIITLVWLCSFAWKGFLFAQGTAFTYQGRLLNTNGPANGIYDLQFALFNAETNGGQLGTIQTNEAVAISNGLFRVTVDFGNQYPPSPCWLAIGVRTNNPASPGSFVILRPRQKLTPTPYAIYAEGASAAGLTGTIPAGDLNGTYGNPITLNNPGNIFDGTFIGSGTGLTGVARLAGGNSFTGNQFITGLLKTGNGSGAGSHTDVIIGPGGYIPGEEHNIDFDDSSAPVGSLILGYSNGQGYFSVGNLYDGTYQSGTKSFTVFGDGNVNVDPSNSNAGFLNNGSTNGAGLTFGSGSGEGIASKRTAGGNQYGLDFYTDFINRLSLNHSGNLELNNNDLYLRNTPYNGLGYRISVAGQSPAGGDGIFLYGFEAGYLGTVYPDEVSLWWDFHGNVWVNNQLTVNGNYLVVNGGTPVNAYLGDDGAGNDVQIGSQKSGVTAVAAYNTADNAYMHFYCSSITIEGGADLAEPFHISNPDKMIPQGAVVVIDDQHPGQLKISDRPYDTRVAGVVSGANGVHPGIQLKQRGVLEGGKNVALTGRVYVLADASNGAIHPGDMLTTSSKPGYAMKVTDHVRATGAILGKAMTSLNQGEGMVLVLIALQ